jgi:hypothetical protein
MAHIPGFPLEAGIFNQGELLTSSDGLAAFLNGIAHTLEVGGEAYLTVSAPTTTQQEPTYTRLAGTWAGGDLEEFTAAVNGVLTYTGPIARTFKVRASVSVAASVTGTYRFRFAVNGADVAKSDQQRTVQTTSIGNIGVQARIELQPNDTLEIQVARVGAPAATLTAESAHLMIVA